MSMLRQPSSFAIRGDRLSGACLLTSDIVLTIHEASLTCEISFFGCVWIYQAGDLDCYNTHCLCTCSVLSVPGGATIDSSRTVMCCQERYRRLYSGAVMHAKRRSNHTPS